MGPARRTSAALVVAPGGRRVRRRPGGSSSAGSVGASWPPSRPSRSSSSDPPSRSKTTGFAVPAILGWTGPVVAASVKTDLLDHTVGHRRRVGRSTCFDPSGVDGAAAATVVAARRRRARGPAPGGRRPRSTEVGQAPAGSHDRRRLLVRHRGHACWPPCCSPRPRRAGTWPTSCAGWRPARRTRSSTCWRAPGSPRPSTRPGPRSARRSASGARSYTTVETLLEPFAGGRARRGAPELDPAAPARPGRDTLYLCAPAHDQRRLTPLSSVVLRSVLDHAYDRVARTGRPLDPPLLVVLDEAANIAPVPDLDALAATAAGHGVQLVTVWHDLAQITARLRPPGDHGGEQPPGQAVPVGHLRPVHPRLRQSPDRRRGAARCRPPRRAAGRARAPPAPRRCGGWPHPTRSGGSPRPGGPRLPATCRRPGCTLRTVVRRPVAGGPGWPVGPGR